MIDPTDRSHPIPNTRDRLRDTTHSYITCLIHMCHDVFTHVAYIHPRECTATHCNTLKHTATHRSTLQHTATLCNTCDVRMHVYDTRSQWRRPIGCLKLQVIFRKRDTNHSALLRKTTNQDKVNDSTPPGACRASSKRQIAKDMRLIHMCDMPLAYEQHDVFIFSSYV